MNKLGDLLNINKNLSSQESCSLPSSKNNNLASQKSYNFYDSKNCKIRVRFAPSPTGFFHFGSARTALFNYLFVKKYQGIFILRIEDTDIERSEEVYKKDIINSLKWLGIKHDEIYIQSERKKIYKKYIEQLLKDKKAYYCFCSKEQIEGIRQDQLSRGEMPHYIGQCYNLSSETIENYLKNKKKYTIRLKVGEKKVVFNDMIRGKIEFDTLSMGDFIIAKDISSPLYNLAVVIDDYEMKISHIIRGEDHISNTPKQILIQKALNIEQPQYAHLPLLLGADKNKLSKRDCQINVSTYQSEGYYPEALINFIALLGWNSDNNEEFFTLEDLIKNFSLKKTQKAGAVCNIQKLDWFNRYYLRQKTDQEIIKACIDYLLKTKIIKKNNENEFLVLSTGKKIDIDFLKEIVLLSKERLRKISDINEISKVFFQKIPAYDKALLLWKNTTEKEILEILVKVKFLLFDINDKDWTLSNIKKVLFNFAEKIGNRGTVFWSLRVALSGEKTSPPLFNIAYILKKNETIQRIEKAIILLSEKRKEKISRKFSKALQQILSKFRNKTLTI